MPRLDGFADLLITQRVKTAPKLGASNAIGGTMKALRIAVIAVLGLTGCGPVSGGEYSGDTVGAAITDATTADALLGTWVAREGPLLSITLKKSWGTRVFTAQHKVDCVMEPCDPATLEGTWSVRGQVLTLKEPTTKYSYGFSLTEYVLTLSSPTNGKVVSRLVHPSGECEADTDCRPGYSCLPDMTDPCNVPGNYCNYPGRNTCQLPPTCESDADCADGKTCIPDPTDPCNQPGIYCSYPGRDVCQ
jgi:hypothetical protein